MKPTAFVCAFPRVLLSVAALALAFNASASTGTFDLRDTTGKEHRLADYKGRYVVVNFWATWCVPCIQEIPEISAFQKAHKDVVVIGIAMDAENPAKVKQFATKVGHDYTLVLSDDNVEEQLGTPHALPATRIYDPTGKVVYDRVGRVTKKVLEDTTKTATSKAGSA
ncbi:MAG TPA: TlpA disulfide reductase family protein [Usitatibacter sp.]|nr:TlpA disulfide reductase family protein [Usitatibacter sp.]